MNPAKPPDEGVELAWRKIQRRLSQVEGFAFLVVFVRDLEVVATLRERASGWLSERGTKLLKIADTEPEQFSARSIEALFAAIHREPTTPVWLEAHRGWHQQRWDEERARFLGLLNERRSRLEAESHAPLLLLLPEGSERETSALAPDLWHARFLSTTLVTQAQSARGVGTFASAERTVTGSRRAGDSAAHDGHAWMTQWLRLFGEDDMVRHELLSDERAQAISIREGADLARALLAIGEVALSKQISDRLLALAEARNAMGSGLRKGATAQDLMVAFGLRREIFYSLGRFDEAVDASRRDLEVSRAYANDLKGFSRLALVAAALGTYRASALAAENFPLAQTLSEEEVELRRQILAEVGPKLSSIRGAVVSLNGAGWVQQRLGDFARARAHYEEAVALARSGLKSLEFQETSELVGFFATASMSLAFVMAMQDEAEQAMSLLLEVVETLRRTMLDDETSLGLLQEVVRVLHVLDYVAQRTGKTSAVVESAERFVELARRNVQQEDRSPTSLRLLLELLEVLKSALAGKAGLYLDKEVVEISEELKRRFPKMKSE